MNSIKAEKIIRNNLNQVAGDFFMKKEILPGEIKGVKIEVITLGGNHCIKEVASADRYDVLYLMDGKVTIDVSGEKYNMATNCIARLPFNMPYVISAKKKTRAHFLRLRKSMDKNDLEVISENSVEHSKIFIRTFEDCPVYTEEIKSSKSLNRMLLPEGKVPRFCMGSVETDGPDEVAEHEHPMLDQLFLGLKDCRCTCRADGKSKLLTENMMLHVPLGSKHAVYVTGGEKLAYIWFDFFLTLDGQEYMHTQHHLEE